MISKTKKSRLKSSASRIKRLPLSKWKPFKGILSPGGTKKILKKRKPVPGNKKEIIETRKFQEIREKLAKAITRKRKTLPEGWQSPSSLRKQKTLPEGWQPSSSLRKRMKLARKKRSRR